MYGTLDLFAGCGGLTDGFKQAQEFELLGAVEWDEHAVATLRERLASKWGYTEAVSRVVHFDIRRTNELIEGYSDDPTYGNSVGLKQLLNGTSLDVVIGGPPCQAYSIAGRISDKNSMKDDYRNFLFESYVNVVEKFKPKACIFENVQGMLSAAPGGISITRRVAEAFDKAGYYISVNLRRDALFDTSEFGVPQKRLRVIILALNKNEYPDHKERLLRFYTKLNDLREKEKLTVSDAISDLPPLYPVNSDERRVSHESKGNTGTIFNHDPRFHNQRDIGIFRLLAEDIESGTNEYTSSDKLKQLYTAQTGRKSSVHKYNVLRLDRPSNTIPAHLYKDGLRHIHPDPKQARSITVREAARIQTFDDDYKFPRGQGHSYKMIGNAVPPKFAKKIALALSAVL